MEKPPPHAEIVPDRLALGGRAVVVTGASRGIGRSLALALARAGAIFYALTRPERVRLDEVHFHPMGQKTEF